ncbi:hypothetical protein KPL78_21305 [Roseomonas sp. HJA6]|uniref:Uncharacterized protein n=1 Tax=Roseomonas alba TaxID=2846776 RepID=A0ABS7AF77_9PROT|nr:hypothetical protein [Neoroseomonas alba]MBW6400412.1 hypothetical protein [Neoroseomonas alba]
MTALLAALWSRIGGWAAAVLAGSGAVLALLAVGRRQGRAEIERQVAQDSLEARERADAASAEYRADGAAGRLRSGRF